MRNASCLTSFFANIARKMPLSTTYLVPAILLNPAFILHLINTFVSRIVYPSAPVISHSPHPFMESLGPAAGTKTFFDIHADDALCWRYTAIMVIVQVLAFRRVQDNRVERRKRKAAKAEREQSRREQVEFVEEPDRISGGNAMHGGLDGAGDTVDEGVDCRMGLNAQGFINGKAKWNGAARPVISLSKHRNQTKGLETESEASLTETSEEEMMI